MNCGVGLEGEGGVVVGRGVVELGIVGGIANEVGMGCGSVGVVIDGTSVVDVAGGTKVGATG